jgi:phage terminase Nu1 subunit (DNA packaging protein)
MAKKKDREAKDRMTEAEEDAQLLKSAESKRRIIRVDKQPSTWRRIARCIPSSKV